jgi:multicomponent Na+:H+ antiporter subunit E
MASIRSLSARAAAWTPPLALAWWVMVEGRPGSWGVGVPTVLAAAAVAALAVPPARRWPRPLALLRFAGFFAVQSLRGGWDVARRALSPAMPMAPGFAEVRTSLPEGAARVLLADVISLLPGTLSVDLRGDLLLLHGLDLGPGLAAEVRDLERRVAEIFGLPWPGGAA